MFLIYYLKRPTVLVSETHVQLVGCLVLVLDIGNSEVFQFTWEIQHLNIGRLMGTLVTTWG